MTCSKVNSSKVESLDLNAEVYFRALALDTEPLYRLVAEATFLSSMSSHPVSLLSSQLSR